MALVNGSQILARSLRRLRADTFFYIMGAPMMVHLVVIGSGLLIHGGSADGAMAAIVSGCFSAIYVRCSQRLHGFIRKGVWYPGVLRASDPRLGGAA